MKEKLAKTRELHKKKVLGKLRTAIDFRAFILKVRALDGFKRCVERARRRKEARKGKSDLELRVMSFKSKIGRLRKEGEVEKRDRWIDGEISAFKGAGGKGSARKRTGGNKELGESQELKKPKLGLRKGYYGCLDASHCSESSEN